MVNKELQSNVKFRGMPNTVVGYTSLMIFHILINRIQIVYHTEVRVFIELTFEEKMPFTLGGLRV